MPAAPLPRDEADRLRALHASGLLEAAADPALDAVVRRAARVFGAPICAVSLVAETRQVFKAAIGLGVPHTSRDVAFCAYAILDPDPLVVLDAARDPRFADSTLVTGDPGIRFYAGAPLFGPTGHRLGTLCVIDIDPRTGVAAADMTALVDMAADVTALFCRGR